MLRQVLIIGALLLAPTLVYVAYVAIAGRPAGADQSRWGSMPWFGLAIAGVALTAVTLGVWSVTGGAPVGGRYVPAHVVDGKIVPGHVETTQPP